jgi:hypothetical protein
MRKTMLTILGSALIVATSVQFAAAAQRHHGNANRAVVTEQQTRNSNAYAAWPAPTVQSDEVYRYSGGFSAPAGH